MSVLCSVLGHKFGDSVIEHGRERTSDAIVFSVTEYEECLRCGERHVISENTRQTRPDEDSSTQERERADQDADETDPAEPAVAPTDDAGPDVREEPDAAPEPDEEVAEVIEDPPGSPGADDGVTAADGVTESDPADDGTASSAGGEDAEILEYEEDEPVPWPETDEVSEAPEPTVDDDAEILGEGEAPWPDQDRDPTGNEDPRPWPSADRDEGHDGAEIPWPDHETEDGSDTDEEPWPDDDGVILGDDEDETDIEAAESVPQDMEERREVQGATFYCPRCPFRKPVTDSSLRAGDICPECRTGYVAVRD